MMYFHFDDITIKINAVEKRLHKPLRRIDKKIEYSKINSLISDTY